MAMIENTNKKSTRPGTLHLPCFEKTAAPSLAPAKPITIKKPLDVDRGALETRADVSPDLAPQYRKGPSRAKAALNELAASLVALTADVAPEPRDTRSLRLALAVVDLAPECAPGFIGAALKAFAESEDTPEPERAAAGELRRAVTGVVLSARLIRFKAMLESAISIIEARRVEAAREH